MFILTSLLAFLIALAQQPEPQSEYVEVRLVQIEVRVTERDGNPVLGLGKEDFVLKDRGEIQQISHVEFVSSPEIEKAVNDPDPETQENQVEPSIETPRIPTWIYMVPEVGRPSEFLNTIRSIRDFLDQNLEPGFQISIGGLPFTRNIDLLQATLDRMAKDPFGKGASSSVVDPNLAQIEDLEFQRQVADAQRAQDGLMNSISGLSRDKPFNGGLADVPLLSVETIDRQISYYGQLALFRYMDLIERMAALPGKKVIVLFRAGFRLDVDNLRLIKYLNAQSIRHRVSLYTVDTRGLEAAVPVEDRRAALAFKNYRWRNQNILTLDQIKNESKDGLRVLAEQTGGKAFVDSNDLGVVMGSLVEDSRDYYVLEYYPTTIKSEGRFHRVEVRVNRPGIKVDSVKGYYEPKTADLLSDKERSLALHQALLSSFPEQLLVEAQPYLFADSLKRPVFVYCAGVRSGDISVDTDKKQIKLDLAVLGHVGHLDLTRLPIYEERRLTHEIEKQRWDSAVRNNTAYVSYRSEIPLTPGRFNWKIVFQNQISGKLGTFHQMLKVPDFRLPSTPSSLLLTREVQSLEGNFSEFAEEGTGILVHGDIRYLPQPANRFSPGDMVYLLYDLYNPTNSDFDAVANGIQMGLLKDGNPVPVSAAHGKAFPDRENGVIRFTAYFSTEGLILGEYKVLAILPNYQTREFPHLEATFELVESVSEEL